MVKTANMNNNKMRLAVMALPVLALVASAATLSSQAVAQSPGSFADPAFQRVWERTDLPVLNNKVARTWVWGPVPGRSLQEPFREAPGGQHLVQYFDKARMEVNYQNVAPTDPYYVTNGLLVTEMVSGQIQTGISQFDNAGPNDAQIAGDPGSDSPSYAQLRSVASVGLPGGSNAATPFSPGANLPLMYVDHTGKVSNGVAGAEKITAGAFINETKHNIPQLFLDYLNAQGPIYVNGQYENGVILNWVTAFGYPVTEPYWTTIKVAGQNRLIMFQAFQRRILTYSPTNQNGWKVEMGNVGAQYYSWRYENPSPQCANVPVRGFGAVWAGNRNVSRSLGCALTYAPFSEEAVIQTAYQPFQHGAMLWVQRQTYTQEKLIYVFFDDGTFQQFTDTWAEGQPVSGSDTPPAGLYQPVRGFGKVWREGTGARVRERLGWATAPEQGATGAYQRFDNGEMYYSAANNKVWVLFNSVGAQATPPPGTTQERTYQVFDNPYKP